MIRDILRRRKNTHFLASEIDNGESGSSRFHVIPAPLEKSVSYGRGTAGGPSAILQASNQLELLTHGFDPSAWGIHTQPALSPRISVKRFLSELEERTRHALEQGAIPVTLGGEHALSFAPIAACARWFPEEIGVIQFDAHADLRTAYEGNPYSHASVMQRVARELDLSIFQVGVRTFCEEEAEFRKEHAVGHIDGPELFSSGRSDIAALIADAFPQGFPDRVYISFDVDVFDASFMPATGTPVPGGLFWNETIELLRSLAESFTIIGFDIVELSPIRDLPYCDFAAAQLAYDLMGFISPASR